MILRLFLLTLILISSLAEAQLVDKTAALVNSDVVTLSDATAFRKNFSLRKEIDPFLGYFRFNPQNHKEVVDYLIQETLILQKFVPTKEEVEEEINAVQRNNQIDREKLKAVLASQGINFDDYSALIRVSVAKRKLMERELRPLSNVNEDDVKNYYYTAPEFAAATKGQKLALSYDLAQMTIPTKILSDEITKRLRAGEDFDALSSEMAGRGADTAQLGMLSEENLSERIREALTGLKVGEASSPLSTGGGYQILKINKIGAPKDTQFEKSKDQIHNILVQKTMSSQLSIWTDKERAEAYIHIP